MGSILTPYKLKREFISWPFWSPKPPLPQPLHRLLKPRNIDATATDKRNMAIQKVVDLMIVKRGTQATKDFLKGNATTNPARLAVKGLFDTLVEKNLISVQTGKIYSTNFWIAFQDNVPFSATLSNEKKQS